MADPTPHNPDTPPPAPKPPAPAPAAKPAAKPAGKEAASRRFFLIRLFTMGWVALGWTSFVLTSLVTSLLSLRFLIPNVLAEPPAQFKVGPPDKFEDGKVNNDFKDKNAWIVHNGSIIYALSTTCTHLGCTPNWLEREQKFKCPCHGSGFYITGINFEGPAPRPLERWGIRIGDDGQIIVDKSKKFQQERGEWTNPESFIKV
jgi:cytochrome b6-f complex iron-sulfur subunit